MSWTDPCGKCGNHRADCDCSDGYHAVWPDEPHKVKFIMTPELEKKIEDAAKIYLIRKYEANFDDDSGITSASFFTAISDDMVSFATTSTKVKDYWQKGMYTEEEVLSLLKRVGKEITYPETYYEPLDTDENNDKYFNGEVEDWFEQNKKK